MRNRLVLRMVICFIAAMCIVGWLSCAGAEEMFFGIGMLKHRTINGSDYVEKKSITPILILGIDQESEMTQDALTNNGQSDFILLVIIDHKDKVIRQLMIDRDTMADIFVTDAFGRTSETKNMQIRLAYAFASTQKEGCELTAKAVGNLLDLEIPLFYSIDLGSAEVLNDVLGGGTATATQEDADVGLNSDQAYMPAALKTIFERVRGDKAFIADALDRLDAVAVTNATRGRLLNEGARAVFYDILPAETLAGEYKCGEDGLGEFHVDREAVETWINENLFEPNS